MHALRTPVTAAARPRLAAPRTAPRVAGRPTPRLQPVAPVVVPAPARLSVVAAAAAGLDPLER